MERVRKKLGPATQLKRGPRGAQLQNPIIGICRFDKGGGGGANPKKSRNRQNKKKGLKRMGAGIRGSNRRCCLDIPGGDAPSKGRKDTQGGKGGDKQGGSGGWGKPVTNETGGSVPHHFTDTTGHTRGTNVIRIIVSIRRKTTTKIVGKREKKDKKRTDSSWAGEWGGIGKKDEHIGRV